MRRQYFYHRQRRLIMTTLRIGLMATWILAACAASASAAPAAGDPAPALVAREIDGARFDLTALRGNVVIVNFWATWCPPCREEMPALDTFYGKFRDRGVVLIGVSVDRSRDRDAVVKVSQSVRYPTAILADVESNGFGKPAVLPITFIVDSAGTVRAVMTPDTTPITEEKLAHVVEPLLAN
jgi:peroxiredoxin